MRRPWIGAKGSRSFHWTRGTSSRNVMEACKRREVFLGMEEEKKGGSVKNFLVLMCARIKHGKNVCRN